MKTQYLHNDIQSCLTERSEAIRCRTISPNLQPRNHYFYRTKCEINIEYEFYLAVILQIFFFFGIEFDRLRGIDFLQKYKWVVCKINWQLKTKYKMIALNKKGEIINKINIDPRVLQILKLKWEHKNKELILKKYEEERVIIPNSLNKNNG